MKSRNVFFLIFDEVEVLDFSGPFDVFSMAKFAAGDNAYRLYTVSESGQTVTALHGLRIEPTYSFETCPADEIDLLIVPGFPPQSVDRFIAENPNVIRWIADRHGQVEVLASVCVGAVLLAAAGVLDGLEATTHAAAFETLRKYAPEAIPMPGARYVDNGAVACSAGVSAGLDLAFHLVRRLSGDPVAATTGNIMEYNPTVNFAAGVS